MPRTRVMRCPGRMAPDDDPNDRTLPSRGAPRRPPRWAVVLTVVGVAIASLVGLLWWRYPAHRLERDIDRIAMPAGVRRTHVVMNDNGYLCIDSCSYVKAYYVASTPPEQLAP